MRYFRNDQVTFPGDLSERMFVSVANKMTISTGHYVCVAYVSQWKCSATAGWVTPLSSWLYFPVPGNRWSFITLEVWNSKSINKAYLVGSGIQAAFEVSFTTSGVSECVTVILYFIVLLQKLVIFVWKGMHVRTRLKQRMVCAVKSAL